MSRRAGESVFYVNVVAIVAISASWREAVRSRE